MKRSSCVLCYPIVLMAIILLGMVGVACAEEKDVPLRNPSFEEGTSNLGTPNGWGRYGGADDLRIIKPVTGGTDGKMALLISDDDPAGEVGITQDVAVVGGEVYRLSFMTKTLPGATSSGAYIQLRWSPSDTFRQIPLSAKSSDEFNEVSIAAAAPADAKSLRIYIYSHAAPTPKVVIDNVKLVSGAQMPPPPPPPAPEPIPPAYDTLKDLHIDTAIVTDGKPACAIVAPSSGIYADFAAAMRDSINKATGVEIPILSDDDTAAAVPAATNLICIGNRSTNQTISTLYDKAYVILDLKYPGKGGYVVRSCHNPSGDGKNIIFVGGSDLSGVQKASQAFIAKIAESDAAAGQLSLGWIGEIELGAGMVPPADAKDALLWEESVMYGSSGYFGWNIVSRNMALYYMTGDEKYAREFLRFAFPGPDEIKFIEEFDGERIENKKDPLAGPYHYSAHMMILFWDLIEESPIFSDDDRLKISNALSRQLSHRAREGVYGRTAPASFAGDRHADWSAQSLYCVARYFQKDYPNPIWEAALKSCDSYFQALNNSAWLAGSNDHLFWYTSYYDPFIEYMMMSGNHVGVEQGYFAECLRTQDVLFTGADSDWGLKASSLNFLLRAADITGDGRFLFYLKRTGRDLDAFRLGWSYWPDASLPPREPTELLGTWTIQRMPEPMWASRGKKLPLEQSFLWGSYRNTLTGAGDFMMIKGHNGGGRNPYHTFAVRDLRLAGYLLLQNYRTQVLTNADGMVEPQVAMNAGLLHADVIGQTVIAQAEVPNMAFCNWRRSVAMRPSQYVLFVDDLQFRTDSQNMEVNTEWQAIGGTWDADRNSLRINGKRETAEPAGWLSFKALDAPCTSEPSGDKFLRPLTSINIQLLLGDEPGGWIDMPFELAEPVTGEVYADLLNYTDRGNLQISLDGETIVDRYQHYTTAIADAQVSLGRHELAAGKHTLRVKAIERPEASSRCNIGLKGVTINPVGASGNTAKPIFELLPCDITTTEKRAYFDNMTWQGAVNEGDHRVMFYLLGKGTGDGKLNCFRVAENAAAFTAPDPAIAAAGQYEGLDGDLVILATNSLYGRNLYQAGIANPLIYADTPIDVDWNFASGELNVVTTSDVELHVAMQRSDKLALDGKSCVWRTGDDGLAIVSLSAGRHTLSSAIIAPPQLAALATALDETLEAGKLARAEANGNGNHIIPDLPLLTADMTTHVGAKPVAVERMLTADGEFIAVAEGSTVHIFNAAGDEVSTMQADGEIRVLRWWREYALLLVGCKDEQVIAFTPSGDRQWVFTSVMDQAVYEAGKQYWFKSAAGHEGIHGLHTGEFIAGDTQAFVGSACTLEVLDHNGQLIKRMPVFWGPGTDFDIINGPDDSRNLLISRWHNGGNTRAIINSENWSNARGFYEPPTGHTFVGGWDAQNRVNDFYLDLDGDGDKEAVAAINGSWNRVTIWNATGAPLYNAQFGPGDRNDPRYNMRDIDVADLDGDGDMEIIIGISKGLVVALDHQCSKIWSKRMPAPPTVVRAVPADEGAKLIVGCEDGSVFTLSGDGEFLSRGHIDGRPRDGLLVRPADDSAVTITTDTGTVATFYPAG